MSEDGVKCGRAPDGAPVRRWGGWIPPVYKGCTRPSCSLKTDGKGRRPACVSAWPACKQMSRRVVCERDHNYARSLKTMRESMHARTRVCVPGSQLLPERV